MSFWQASNQVVIFHLVELSMTKTQTTSDRLPKEIYHSGRKAVSGIPKGHSRKDFLPEGKLLSKTEIPLRKKIRRETPTAFYSREFK